jgi:hypothetical protein
LLAALWPDAAGAACHQQENAASKVWHPSVQDEFASSRFVLEGVALRAEPVFLPSDHRLLMTRYTVRVLHAFKGRPGKTIVLTSKNTVQQFPMETGAKYLLFIQKELIAGARGGSRAHWYVYDCGNSGVLDGKDDALLEMLALSERLARAQHPKHVQHRASAAPHA